MSTRSSVAGTTGSAATSPVHSTNEPRRSLASRALSAVGWNYAGAVAKIVSQLTIGVVLARVLGPSPFGVLAVVWLITGVATLIADFGLSAALIQKPDVDENEIRSVFTWQLVSGVAFAAATAAAHGYLARAFREPGLDPILPTFSLFFVLQSVGATAASLLRRELRFRVLQLGQITSYLLGFGIVGIGTALSGFGVWSLVWANLVQALVFAAWVLIFARHPMRPRLALPSRSTRSFGGGVLGVNLGNHGMSNVDTFMISRCMDAAALGTYSRTMQFLLSPATAIVGVLQTVLFPAYSRATQSATKVADVFLCSLWGVALTMFPAYFAAAVASRTIVLTLFGPQWSAAVSTLPWLALAIPVVTLSSICGPLVWGKGHAHRELIVLLQVAPLWVALLFVSTRVSVPAVGMAFAAVAVVKMGLIFRQANRLAGCSMRDVCRNVIPGVLLGIVSAVIVGTVDRCALLQGANPPLTLALDVGAGSVACLITLRFLCRYLWSAEAKTVVQRVVPPSSRGYSILRMIAPRVEFSLSQPRTE